MTTTENTQNAKSAPKQQPSSSKKSEADIARENSPLVRFLGVVGPILAPLFLVIGYFFKALHWTLNLVFSDNMMKGIDAFFGKVLDSIINDEIVGVTTAMVLMAVVVWSAPDPLKHLGTLNWCKQVGEVDVEKLARHYRIPLQQAAGYTAQCMRYKLEGKLEADNSKSLAVDTEKSADDVTWDEKTREFEEERKEKLKSKALNPKVEHKAAEEDEINPDDFIDF